MSCNCVSCEVGLIDELAIYKICHTDDGIVEEPYCAFCAEIGVFSKRDALGKAGYRVFTVTCHNTFIGIVYSVGRVSSAPMMAYKEVEKIGFPIRNIGMQILSVCKDAKDAKTLARKCITEQSSCTGIAPKDFFIIEY